MKTKLLIYCLLSFSGVLISFNQARAGYMPLFMMQYSPTAGSSLYSGNQIGFSFGASCNTGTGTATSHIVGGYIRVYKSANDSLVDLINVTDSTAGYYQYNYIITAQLECNVQYYIMIDPGSYANPQFTFDSIRNCQSPNNVFVWNFTTAAMPVAITATSPVYFCGGGNATLSANTYNSYLWSDGETSQSIVVHNPGTYFITVTDANGCHAFASHAVSGLPADYDPICLVTVDTLSQNNLIIWDKSHPSPIDSFIVYREITSDNYQPVGAVPYNGALSMFKDTVRTRYFPNTGDPNAGTYRYKLQILDTCGNLSALSPYHNTIYISNNDNGTFSWVQLYTIEGAGNPVTSYILMRDDSSNGNWHVVNSVAGTQYTITDPAYNDFKTTASWRVETQWGISCSPIMKVGSVLSGTFSTSISNMNTNRHLGIAEVANQDMISMYPNPFSSQTTLRTNNYLKNATLTLDNCFGQTVRQMKNISGQTITLYRDNLPSGLYFYRLTQDNKVFEIGKLVISGN